MSPLFLVVESTAHDCHLPVNLIQSLFQEVAVLKRCSRQGPSDETFLCFEFCPMVGCLFWLWCDVDFCLKIPCFGACSCWVGSYLEIAFSAGIFLEVAGWIGFSFEVVFWVGCY